MLTGSHHINVRNAGVLVDRLISTMTLSPVRLAAGSCPCRTKTAVNRGSSVFPKNNPSSFLTGTTHALLTHQPVGACEINGETIAHELERRRNATGKSGAALRINFLTKHTHTINFPSQVVKR
jgi:hypothetical protein